MEEGNYIRDISALEQLNNMIAYSGEAMANIEDNVSRYLDGVQEVLEHQLEAIEEQLDEAKERLAEAEQDLSSCEASQRYDEENHEYYPSCSGEECAVRAAREEVDEWQRKYDQGLKIINQCKSEIGDYNDPGGCCQPPGGHYFIENMCNQQTLHISEQLRDYIADAKEIINMDVGGVDGAEPISNPNVRETDLPRSVDERNNDFQHKIEGIKKNQADDAVYRGIRDANRAMRCPNCGMPPALCKCRVRHQDINLYQ